MQSWRDLKFWTSTTYDDIARHLHKNPNYQPADPFKVFTATPFDRVRVVILGQDPYPTPGHATGLAFSVPSGTRPLPPSLRNIFKELCDDLHTPYPSSGDLTPWAEQGVLLLNTALTVEPYKPASHANLGWSELTAEVLQALDYHKQGLIFILWGKHAQAFLPYILPSIEQKRHHVILSPHPSPFSADRGFFGSRPFSKTNALLSEPVNWRLP